MRIWNARKTKVCTGIPGNTLGVRFPSALFDSPSYLDTLVSFVQEVVKEKPAPKTCKELTRTETCDIPASTPDGTIDPLFLKAFTSPTFEAPSDRATLQHAKKVAKLLHKL